MNQKHHKIWKVSGFRQAFEEHERRDGLRSWKIACILVFFLMPLGVVLDWMVYEDYVPAFLTLRFACSAVAAVIWYLLHQPFGVRNYRLLAFTLALAPALAISVMISLLEHQAPTSPYYAGLNLVMLAMSVIVRWNLGESIVMVVAILTMYLVATVPHLQGTTQELNKATRTTENLRKDVANDSQLFFNNLYFLLLTSGIVVTGNYILNQIRFREFALRFELDRNQKALEENNRKLTELDEAKSRFFANISHELRTPLTLLLAPLETIIHQKNHIDSQTQANLLSTMHTNSMRLLKLINDLLDLVKMDSGQLKVKNESIDLDRFLKGIGSSIDFMIQDNGLHLEIEVSPDIQTLLIDRDKLEKIILNLLFNAMKFTQSGGRVSVVADHSNDRLDIRVADTGVGIASKNIAQIFDRFWQADTSSRRKYQGTGIGLALVKEFVEVIGGSIHVESRTGEGTTFHLSFPYIVSNFPAQKEIPIPAFSNPDNNRNSAGITSLGRENGISTEVIEKLYRRADLFPAMTPLRQTLRKNDFAPNTQSSMQETLLIADDEPEMLSFLNSQLSERYQVIEAIDGLQAFELSSQFLPDLILLDMMMPEIDGIECCQKIREKTSTRDIPILMITARADEETKLRALESGVSDFLTKPFSITELHLRIKNLIESFCRKRELGENNRILQSTIDQLKETESKLVQNEKMASLGRLSSGIIHEINNPLNYAKTGLYTLRRTGQYLREEQKDSFDETLKDIDEGINQIVTIISDLKTFSQHKSQHFNELSVRNIIEKSLRLVHHPLKKQTEIETRYEEGLTLWGNENKLIQVFINLIRNALDAIKDKAYSADEKPLLTIEGMEEGKASSTN